jgi:hypothetical protein
MAEPKLEIERRVERQDKAIRTMASWLVQAQTGFGQKDYEGIVAILDGTETTSDKSADSAE